MSMGSPTVKRFAVDRTDRVDVLNALRTRIGSVIPVAHRLDDQTASFDWIDGAVATAGTDLPDDALKALGEVVKKVHLVGRELAPAWGLTSIANLPNTIARLRSSAAAVGLNFDPPSDAAEWTLSWTHGDLSTDNIVYSDDWREVAGIIDWEFMAWDLPILDVVHALWRVAGWSNWKIDSPDWARRKRRTVALLHGYGWTGQTDDLVIALRFLLERRVEVIDAIDRSVVPAAWMEELQRCQLDLDILRREVERYRMLPGG